MTIQPEGCKIEPLDNKACQAVLEWVAGGAGPRQGGAFTWLLAHCHDGVTWGRLDGVNWRWHLSSTPFPDLCPCICESNLLEMRLFGSEMETLIWRIGSGFLGRCLIDEPEQDKGSYDETRILLGDRILEAAKDGFTCVDTAAGMKQAVPLECTDQDFTGGRWPLRLKVRHYFEEDQETGAVRVVASRLVDVFKEVR